MECVPKTNTLVDIFDNQKAYQDDAFKKCPFCGYGHLRIAKEGVTTTGDCYVSVGCSNYVLSSCEYYQTYFYKQPPTRQQVENLILAYPENLESLAENPPLQTNPNKIHRSGHIGFVDTNQINSRPQQQWPTNYSDDLPSWFKKRIN